MEELKICTICGVSRPMDSFSKRIASKKDGLSASCKNCKKNIDADYYQKNRDVVLGSAKRWYSNNKDKKKEYDSGEKRKDYNKKRQPLKNLETQNYRARKIAASVDGWVLTEAWWLEQIHQQENRCFYCKRGEVKLTVEHVFPLSKGGKHSSDNIVAACESCNYSKRDLLPYEFNPDVG
jgi:5-methylcytosine-specific restriction endonuclease McrA